MHRTALCTSIEALLVFDDRRQREELSLTHARTVRMSKGRPMLDVDACELPPAGMPRVLAAFLAACSLLAAGPAAAQDAPAPPVTIGAGVRTSYVHTDLEDEDGTDRFLLDSLRLYVSGPVTNKIKFMVNTEYDGGTNHVGVLDAVARFEFSDKFNIWAGRLIAPSDRANLYGPYYAHHWASFTDSIQDGYPTVATGRSNGAMYWGQFGKVKLAGGGFDGPSQTSSDTMVGAGRIMVDFWDPEAGYYLNGTYYGDKNILAIGGAGQFQGGDKGAYNVDFLMEKKAGGGGMVGVEAEWAKYDGLGGWDGNYGTSDGGYVLGSYLFPKMGGPGQWEILGKYAQARFREGNALADVDYDQKTTEVNFNYVIKQFNARVMMFYKDTRFDAVKTNNKQFGVGLQLQM